MDSPKGNFFVRWTLDVEIKGKIFFTKETSYFCCVFFNDILLLLQGLKENWLTECRFLECALYSLWRPSIRVNIFTLMSSHLSSHPWLVSRITYNSCTFQDVIFSSNFAYTSIVRRFPNIAFHKKRHSQNQNSSLSWSVTDYNCICTILIKSCLPNVTEKV